MQPVEKLKICLIIPTKFSAIGGYQNLVRALANELNSCSTVQVVCPCTANEREEEKKIQIYPILKISASRLGFLLNLLPNLLFTYNYLRKERPHVVNAHPCYPPGLFALPAKLLGIPIVGTAHGGDILMNRKLEYGNRRNFIAAKLTKFTLGKINLLTVVSKSLIPDAISAGADPSKIRVIYNGIDPKRNQIQSNKDILERFQIANNDFVVLYVGRLMLIKRPADLVKAFSLVLKSISNAKLVIAGEGPEEANLKRLAIELDLEDRTTFAGFVTGLDLDALYARCDVFVLPSEVEAFGITILEAMAYQKPVIASNIGAFVEILQDHKTGIIVPVGAVDRIASAIIEVHADEYFKTEMGKQARAEVEKRFNISKTARDYLEVYRALIDNT
jgi:glycosyltransferase involved in cell wall biosynthesis